MLVAARDRNQTEPDATDNALGPAPLMPHQGSNPLPMPSTTASSPPSYTQSAAFPEAPTTDLVLPAPRPGLLDEKRLPPLSSLTGGQQMSLASPQWQPHMRTLPPSGSLAALSPRTESTGTMENGSVSAASPDGRLDARSGSVSLDDPDVRLAAEALGDLRAGKHAHAPPPREMSC